MGKKKEEEETELSAPLAYVNAYELLVIARKFALERKDPNALIDIANSWIEMGHHLLTAEVTLGYDGDDEESSATSEPPTIGFSGGSSDGKEIGPGPGADKDKPRTGF